MHQIGNTFTRLEPAIEFAEASFQSNPNTVCIIGNPPERFASIHSQGLLNAWYKRLQRCEAEPVQLEQRRGHRRVQVLGTAIFDFDAEGLLSVYGWDFDESDRIMLLALPSKTVVVEGVPYQSLWMERLQLGATRALRQRHPGQDALIRSYVTWAQAQLISQSWDTKTQEQVRYQIAVELDLDSDVLETAVQIQMSSQPQRPLRADVYNHVITYRQDFLTLNREAPQLIPLYGLLAEDLAFYDSDAHWEVTERMRQFLLHTGIKPAFWRLLCREGTQWMHEFLAYYDLDRHSHSVPVVDMLRIVQAFGAAQLVPAWLLHAFMQLGGNPNAPTVGIADRLDDMFALCARLGHLAAQADEASLEVFKDRAIDICGWASDYWEKMPIGYIRRATLRGLIRKTDAQQSLDAMQLQGSKGWKVPYKLALKTPEVQAVILDSALAIWTEGRDMRHCAARYIDACKRGDYVMVSFRSPNRSRALATVAFEVRTCKVSQKKLSGFANALVSAEVLKLAKECQRQLQSQQNRMSKPKSDVETQASESKPITSTGFASWFRKVLRSQKNESIDKQ